MKLCGILGLLLLSWDVDTEGVSYGFDSTE